MARPPKLKERDQAKILAQLEAGGNVGTLAHEFGVTVQYVYKLKREAKAVVDDLTDKGNENIDTKRNVIGRRECITGENDICLALPLDYDGLGNQRYPEAVAKRHYFDLYDGDKNKHFCSKECFERYKAFDFSKPDNRNTGHNWFLMHQNQGRVVKINAPYFADVAEDFDLVEVQS